MSNPQKLVIHLNKDKNLFYIGSYNSKTHVQSSSMAQNYNRAKYLKNTMVEGKSEQGLKSGFMMAIINTDFEGWDNIIVEEEYSNPKSAALAKVDLIDKYSEEYKYVGSDRIYIKGINKIAGAGASWAKKFNIANMNQDKIRDKIDFICRSIDEVIPSKIYTDAYMTIVTENYGKRKFNWCTYEVNDLISLFRFTRNYIGKDLLE